MISRIVLKSDRKSKLLIGNDESYICFSESSDNEDDRINHYLKYL